MPTHRSIRDEAGAETLEFAFAAPVLLLLVFGLIFALIALASQVSLSQAASVGVRYASIPTDPVWDRYPEEADVAKKVDAATPFFDAAACTTTVVGDERQNAEVLLEVDCRLPNPLAEAVNGLLSLLDGRVEPTEMFSDAVTVSARAKARRE